MYPEFILHHSREKNLSAQDAAQTFLQGVVLKHLSLPQARFMGGTALVLGYANPRFSEDVDLTQVDDPEELRPGLTKAKAEIEQWFGRPATLTAPKPKGRTWRLTVRLTRADSVQLHVDSQPYRAYTTRPLVLTLPPLSPFVCEALDLDEILAEKIMALAYRRYLGGRDLFDLWFHWLRLEEGAERKERILDLLKKKLRERSLKKTDFEKSLTSRLQEKASLIRARQEWKRYLPADFQRETLFQEILSRCRKLPEIVA